MLVEYTSIKCVRSLKCAGSIYSTHPSISGVDSDVNMSINTLCTVNGAWLNTSQRSQVGVGMNRFAGEV